MNWMFRSTPVCCSPLPIISQFILAAWVDVQYRNEKLLVTPL